MVYICGICQDDMEATGTVALPCGHTFDLNWYLLTVNTMYIVYNI